MGAKDKINWAPEASAHCYEAAGIYLSLLFPVAQAKRIVAQLKPAPTIEYEAKDILRASQTHLLEKDDPKVRETLKDIKRGKQISPVLLVRGQGRDGVSLIIADGHHRICASWYWDEKCPVACSIVNVPRA